VRAHLIADWVLDTTLVRIEKGTQRGRSVRGRTWAKLLGSDKKFLPLEQVLVRKSGLEHGSLSSLCRAPSRRLRSR
jgi:hypothetical protein